MRTSSSMFGPSVAGQPEPISSISETHELAFANLYECTCGLDVKRSVCSKSGATCDPAA